MRCYKHSRAKREGGDGVGFEVVGEAYVHGLMHREWFGQEGEVQDVQLGMSGSKWDDLKMLDVY